MNWFKKHSLGIAAIVLWVVSLVLYWFAQLPDWRGDEELAGGSTAIWPDYTGFYVSKVLEGWTAEFFALFFTVYLTKWLFERKSAESKREKELEEE